MQARAAQLRLDAGLLECKASILLELADRLDAIDQESDAAAAKDVTNRQTPS